MAGGTVRQAKSGGRGVKKWSVPHRLLLAQGDVETSVGSRRSDSCENTFVGLIALTGYAVHNHEIRDAICSRLCGASALIAVSIKPDLSTHHLPDVVPKAGNIMLAVNPENSPSKKLGDLTE